MLLQREIGRLRARVVALSAGAVLGCAAFAVPAGATQLRHYEQVSPAEKGDGDIIAEGKSTMASDAGDAAAFESRMVFGDAVGSGMVGRTTYVARRDAGGWSTHSVTPMPRTDAIQVLPAPTRVEMFADDLSSAFVWAYDLPAVADDQPLQENLYSEDTRTGELRTISKTQQDPITVFDFLNTDFGGYSADGKHIAFASQLTPFGFTRLLPEAAPDVPNVYKWDDGVLSVVGLLPDGSVPPTGATIDPNQIKGTMSADGSRLVFSASPDGSAPSQLYLHVDGRGTVWVSEPERGSGDRTPANGVHFEGMTPDGNNVFFSSEEPLVDEDTAPGPDEYRFTYSADAASNNGNLTLITNDGQAMNDPSSFGGTLIGMSDDGRSVYLHEASGVLALWQAGLSSLTTVDPSIPRSGGDAWLTLVAPQGKARVSPDGNWLAYIKEGQMYFYDRSSQSLTCVSCPSDASIVPTITNTGGHDYRGFRPRFLSDDGKVFFTSTGSLVPEDTNGVADVYEYDGPTGTLSLLSTGKGRDPTAFVDASRSGDDVFIVTRQQLVKSDRDDYVDVYDVRVGAAPPEQPLDTAPACDGDACQGAVSATPADEAIGGSLEVKGDMPAEAGDARLTVRHSITLRAAAGLLRVKLSAAGRIAWRGKGLVSGSLRRRSAGTVKLHLRLRKSARTQLERSGHYKTAVRLTFHAAGGSKAMATVHVTFKAQQRKGR